METKQAKSKARLIAVLVVVIAIIIIAVGAAIAVVSLGNSTQSNETKTVDFEIMPDEQVTQQSLNQQSAEVKESLDQSKQDHATAKKTVDDLTKQTKVSE